MDLISELPEHIVHRVLYFLPNSDAARTSALSKTWKSMWSSCPTLRIDQSFFTPSSVEQFLNRSLQNCLAQNIGLETLSLRITYEEDRKDVIDQLINFAAKSRTLEEVHIEFRTPIKRPCYGYVPASILSCQSLTKLHLYGCKLENLNDINIPHLQWLGLRRMDVDETIIYHLMLKFPTLEVLIISACHNLTSLKVPSILEKLKIIVVTGCYKLAKIEVPALTSLEYFSFRGVQPMSKQFLPVPRQVQSMPCEINLEACDTLKCLRLASVVNMSREWLENQLSKSVGLEFLELEKIHTLEIIKISSPKLKRLVIDGCKNLSAETEIDAPHLHAVEYIENKLPYYSLSTPNYLKKATFKFYLGDHVDHVWFHELKQLFETAIHVQDLNVTITCNKSKTVIIHEELTYSLLPILEGLKDLDLHVIISSKDIVDSLLMRRCDNVYVASSNINDSSRVFQEKILDKRGETACCKYIPHKCLVHRLIDIEIESINWEDDNESVIASKNIPLLKAHQNAFCNLTKLNFKWLEEESLESLLQRKRKRIK